MATSTKERIKEQLFREALCSGRVRPCDGCNEYQLTESLTTDRRSGDQVCSHCHGHH